jgi:flagellar motility protein MotE (MotC chaperone)
VPPAQPSLAIGRFSPFANQPDTRSAVERFCTNIADAAADARFVAQKRELERLAGELDARLARLDDKTKEYQKWLARRDEFAGKVREALTGMYAKMKPESAALHLAAMDEETAAALLLKLNVRQASAILNEMPAERAARLAMIVSGAAGAEPAKPAAQAAPSDTSPQAAPDPQRGRT